MADKVISRKLLLVLALCLICGGCAAIDSGPAVFAEAPPVHPIDALLVADLGSHVRALLANGNRVSGYLVARGTNEFTLRGIGWQASRLTSYDEDDLVEFVVSDPQPNTKGLRF